MSRRHLAHQVAVTLLVLVALALIGWLIASRVTTHDTANTAQTVLRQAAVQANIAAQSTPNPSCNPQPGAGKLGVCAPVQAEGAVATIAKAAGDPAHVSGHPLGVDVSSYQGCAIGWRSVPVDFAIVKATEGTGYTDPCLSHNVAGLRAANKLHSTYDFLRPSYVHTAVQEADHYANAVILAGANGSLPPVADVEVNAGLSPSALHAYVCRWAARVEQRLGRHRVIIYTGDWFWGPQVGGDSCGGAALWDSAYAFLPIVPSAWRAGPRGDYGLPRDGLWQFSDGHYGPTPHINGWDSDVFSGSLAGLRGMALGGGRRQAPAGSVLTKAERRNIARLQAERRIAKRHGGWGKVAASHLRRAVAAKTWLRARAKLLRRLGLGRAHRAARLKLIQAAVGG